MLNDFHRLKLENAESVENVLCVICRMAQRAIRHGVQLHQRKNGDRSFPRLVFSSLGLFDVGFFPSVRLIGVEKT